MQETEKKKSSSKKSAAVKSTAATVERKSEKKPRIVTKDDADDNFRPYTGATVDPAVIDRTVFDEDEQSPDEEPITGYYHKSMTIDNNILSREQLKPDKKKRRRPKTIDITAAERFEPDCDMGLSQDVVDKRIEQGYDNYVKRNVGKSYLNIFVSNIFTFFNVLCFAVFAALLVVEANLSQCFFMVIITANILLGIIQEIRSKITIDKLSIVSAPTAVVIRGGERKVIPTHDIVLDDIVCFEMGKQICADSVIVRGECEVNESMLTGES